MVRGLSVFVEGIKSTDFLKSIWLFLMFKISPRLIPVSNAKTMIRRSLSLVVVSNFCSSPFSSLLVRGLSALGKEIILTGFWGRAMPQSLDAIVNTLLKITSSRFKEAGEMLFNRRSR